MAEWRPGAPIDRESTEETEAVITTRRRPSDPELPEDHEQQHHEPSGALPSEEPATIAKPPNLNPAIAAAAAAGLLPHQQLGVPRALQPRAPRFTGPPAPQPSQPPQQPSYPPAVPHVVARAPMATGPAYPPYHHEPPTQQQAPQPSHAPLQQQAHQAQELQQPSQSEPSQSVPSQWVTSFHFRRSRTYAFVVDARQRPIEIGSGRFARVYLGQERWQESVTDLQRDVVIKMMHKNLDADDAARFKMEKELLERVQGHPNIVELLGSGECSDPRLPSAIRDQTAGDFMILEKLDMNLEERLKGSRDPRAKEDLLSFDMHDRLLRVLEYIVPIASAIEYAHLVRNVSHRDINPSNVLIGLPDPHLAGARMQVRLADFSVAKLQEGAGVTRFSYGVPGTMYFQSPEQETNIREILVNVHQGSGEVEYFEDFYVSVAKNDTFAIFNRQEEYTIAFVDRVRKRIVLTEPYGQRSETNIRARIQKCVGRPADIYALGGLLYYLITGATGNPKVLYDTFSKFIEYEHADESNTIDAYLRHDYQLLNQMQSQRSPKSTSAPDASPANRFFSYKHYFDGNGELIHPAVMTIIARCMIRNKPDSYCQTHELDTTGVTNLVRNMTTLYSLYGIAGANAPVHFPLRREVAKGGALAIYSAKTGGAIRKLYEDYLRPLFDAKRK